MLQVTLECYHIGLVCVRKKKALVACGDSAFGCTDLKVCVFTTVPLQLVQDSLPDQHLYSSTLILVKSWAETLAGQSWMEMCVFIISTACPAFSGLHAVCDCEKNSEMCVEPFDRNPSYLTRIVVRW